MKIAPERGLAAPVSHVRLFDQLERAQDVRDVIQPPDLGFQPVLIHLRAVQDSGFGVQGSGFRVQGLGFRVLGPGFWVQD